MGCGCGKSKLTRKQVVTNAQGQQVELATETLPPKRGGQSTSAKVIRSAPVPSFNRVAA